MRSQETKWDTIEHDVAKFIGAYQQVLSCREFGALLDNVL